MRTIYIFVCLFFFLGITSGAAAQQSHMTQSQRDRHALATEAANGGSGDIHLDVDFGFHRTFVAFLTKGDVAPEACQLLAGCESPTLELMTMRGLLGFGFGGLTVEGGFEMPLTDDSDTNYGAGLFGIRVDTSSAATFYGHFRVSAVVRFGALSGGGARASFGLDIRPVPYLIFYLEGAAEVISARGVSGEGLNSTIISYGYQLGGGLRASLPFE